MKSVIVIDCSGSVACKDPEARLRLKAVEKTLNEIEGEFAIAVFGEDCRRLQLVTEFTLWPRQTLIAVEGFMKTFGGMGGLNVDLAYAIEVEFGKFDFAIVIGDDLTQREINYCAVADTKISSAFIDIFS